MLRDRKVLPDKTPRIQKVPLRRIREHKKAAEADIDAVTEIYDHIHDEEESCSIGWQRVAYPVRATAETAVSLGELFVLEYAGARRG